jgi:asparagine synthase (glutamine-hydrolysing)
MEAVSRGAKEGGGQVIGVTVEVFARDFELVPNAFVDQEIKTTALLERIDKLVELGDGYVVLPGGAGTFAELGVVWNLALLGALHGKPLVVVGPGWERVLRTMIDELHTVEADLRFLRLVPDVDAAVEALRATLIDAVRVRVDTDLRIGVVLSGGLDSSLTLLLVRQLHPDCVAFTVGTEGSEDLAYARRLTADLGVQHVVVPVRPQELGLREVREAMRVSELTEYGDIINAVVSQRLFAAVHQAGVKVVLTGDGSDELFGGYSMYRRIGDADRRRLFLHKIAHLSRTELQRVDRTSMGHRVEARVPFLDVRMLDLAMRIPQELKYRDGYEKWIVRHAFADLLPDYVAARHKNPMSHSSGLHERIRLFRPLFPRLYRRNGYQCAAPLQRDFSEVLKEHGYDLDAAVAAARPARDLSLAEHGRDFAGAVRWNLTNLVRRRSETLPS